MSCRLCCWRKKNIVVLFECTSNPDLECCPVLFDRFAKSLCVLCQANLLQASEQCTRQARSDTMVHSVCLVLCTILRLLGCLAGVWSDEH